MKILKLVGLVMVGALQVSCKPPPLPNLVMLAPQTTAEAQKMIGLALKRNSDYLMERTPYRVFSLKDESAIKSNPCSGSMNISREVESRFNAVADVILRDCGIKLSKDSKETQLFSFECSEYISTETKDWLSVDNYCGADNKEYQKLSAVTPVVYAVVKGKLSFNETLQDQLETESKCVARKFAEAKIGYLGAKKSQIRFKSTGYSIVKTEQLQDICKNFVSTCGIAYHPPCQSAAVGCQKYLTIQNNLCVPCGEEKKPVCSQGEYTHGCDKGLIAHKEGICVPCGGCNQPKCLGPSSQANGCQTGLKPNSDDQCVDDVGLIKKSLEDQYPAQTFRTGRHEARAPGRKLGAVQTVSKEICYQAPDHYKISSAVFEASRDCWGGRCNVSEVTFNTRRTKACVTISAWSEDTLAGAGGSHVGRLKGEINITDEFRETRFNASKQCKP